MVGLGKKSFIHTHTLSLSLSHTHTPLSLRQDVVVGLEKFVRKPSKQARDGEVIPTEPRGGETRQNPLQTSANLRGATYKHSQTSEPSVPWPFLLCKNTVQTTLERSSSECQKKKLLCENTVQTTLERSHSECQNEKKN